MARLQKVLSICDHSTQQNTASEPKREMWRNKNHMTNDHNVVKAKSPAHCPSSCWKCWAHWGEANDQRQKEKGVEKSRRVPGSVTTHSCSVHMSSGLLIRTEPKSVKRTEVRLWPGREVPPAQARAVWRLRALPSVSRTRERYLSREPSSSRRRGSSHAMPERCPARARGLPELHLDLRPAGVVAEGFRVQTFGVDGITMAEVDPAGHNCFYQGTVRNHSASSAAISTCSGLSGLIRMSGDEFFITPAA
ncbi:hypothetical protein AOLI_G00283230 [Acnodon oligacanthus]